MLKQTLIAMLATMVLACSKEEKISVDPGSFNTGMKQVEAISTERPGHYCYNLEIVRGENFHNKLYLNVNRNGSTGDLRVNGKEYQDDMELGGTDNLLRIEYLPFSAGNHNVELIITDNSKAVKSSINLYGCFALGVNQVEIPYMAWEYKPPFTNVPEGAEYFSTKNKFPANREGLITVDHGGDGWLYVRHDGKVTGCFMKQTGTEYVEIEHLVIDNIDFNGPMIIEKGKLPIIYGIKGTNRDFYFNITGVYPANATCQNPTIDYFGAITGPIHSLKKIGLQVRTDGVFSFPCRIYNPITRKYEEKDIPIFEGRGPSIVIDNGVFLSADDERRNVKTLYQKKGERIKITTTT